MEYLLRVENSGNERENASKEGKTNEFEEFENEWKNVQNDLKQQMIEIDNVDFEIPFTTSDETEEDKIDIEEVDDDDDEKEEQTTTTATTTTSTAAASTTPNKSNKLRYVGGVDISFVKDNMEDACASIVILKYPSLKVVYEIYEFVKLTLPYIPGFLAFRECPSLIPLIERIKTERPELFPQVLLVDGNGMLHTRGFGLACHLGVLADLPTIGVGKTFFCVDGMSSKQVKLDVAKHCKSAGDYLPLQGESGKIWGAAVISHSNSTNAIFISQGHRLSLDSSLKIIRACTTTNRVPEPVRQADLRSRDFIRKNYKP
ncbi:endonuclease V [Heterostelium album PN500]|uniref:Endonuclease V n=1 Tax=Heterostelium pallidum (strain ATCC 26659 / Pp 5 / PN500) TaxID=670386 RepID=D3AZG0_HETP5|nr:endonuclease V [Heterostelium album PN500]EFA85543.1 endonuclease V [Heterostelium album PN500]|eukprot:XP_020437651.1 endonuclease V [Heterostelium album PN500]